MPDVPTAHLRTSEVMRWREPNPSPNPNPNPNPGPSPNPNPNSHPNPNPNPNQVMRYREPPPKEEEPEADSQGGGSSGEDGTEGAAVAPSVQRKSLRDRTKVKSTFAAALATEAQGISLHLDPRCSAPGYSGTGYKVAELSTLTLTPTPTPTSTPTPTLTSTRAC